MEQLITDRTQTDVNRALYLMGLFYFDASTGETGFYGTEEELAEWNAGCRGSYNASDLNRVGRAVRYVADQLRQAGFSPTVNPKTDWAIGEYPTASQMAQYIADIKTLRDSLVFPDGTPDAPDLAQKLTYQKANAIETIVSILDTLITSLQQIYIRANIPTAYAGLAYYVPEMTYLLCDSEGVKLLDNTGVQLISR